MYEQHLPDAGMGFRAAVMGAFDLQGAEEALEQGVVVTIAGSAHRGHGADRHRSST
jgi:hypothetical protein